jgi:alpha-L-rhamnosidase
MISLALLCLTTTVLSAESPARVENLRCEYRVDPLGIDVRRPRLYWQLRDVRRGAAQTAYQVLVASTPEQLARNEGDLWDSGRVASTDSAHVEYAGRPLGSRIRCHWKVRVWDTQGQTTPYSRPALWSMGLLEPSDWRARWIGLDGGDTPALLPACLQPAQWIWYPEARPAANAPVGTRLFRRQFDLPANRPVREARLWASADNRATVYVNGHKLGSAASFRTPAEFDVGERLHAGVNTLAFEVTNAGEGPNPAGLIAGLQVDFGTGSPLQLASDATWLVAQRAPAGWEQEQFQATGWRPAQLLGRSGIKPWGELQPPSNRRLPARYLRREFQAKTQPVRATVWMSGLGLSELYVNGRKAGDRVLDPGLTEYSKRVFYVTHDVTDLVRAGKNALGVILGNGRYYAPRMAVPTSTRGFGYPKLLLQMRLEFADGSVRELTSDESWRLTTEGPIRANNEYDGEDYDARMDLDRWSEPGYDDAAWQQAPAVTAPDGFLAAQMSAPIRVIETLRPRTITEPRPGVYVFDMGQNMVGWCRLKVSGPRGTTVTLRHAEILQPDGMLYRANLRSAKATATYVLRGLGTERYEPRFTYFGFRYVELTGLPSKPSLETIEGCVVHDDVAPAGTFACSSRLLNRIHDNIRWGVRGNYRSISTDCPQRDERQGWLGDRSCVSRGESYQFDIAALYSKWLTDMHDAQRENGSVSDVCPAYWPIYSDNVVWPSTFVVAPGMLYEQYGDRRPIAQLYDGMARWIELIGQPLKDGILPKQRDRYGDWCVPPESPELIHSKDPARQTSKELLATSYYYYDVKQMARYATLLGKADDARRYTALAETIRRAFHARFYRPEAAQYDNGAQTSSVLPLAFGLVPEDQQRAVFAKLVDNILGTTKGHIGTGLVGGQWLMRVLSDHGRPDVAWTLATQETYPSWGYMVNHGATTVWELWNGDTADPAMNSGNHVMLVGDLCIWMYEYLAGIRSDPARPGFRHVILRPVPVPGLTFARATHESLYGTIASDWRIASGRFVWKLTVPPNTTATLYVPSAGPVQGVEGLKPLGQRDGATVFAAPAGSYTLIAPAGPVPAATQASQPAASERATVACYYFPNYHPSDARNAKVKGPGWSEWELVKAARPRFPGHQQPNVPAWGYTDESDPQVMAQKIGAAADHGVDAFIFDWYYYDDGPYLERCLEQGFLKAANCQRLKFGLMWANHDWIEIHPYHLGQPRPVLYHGAVTPQTFERMTDYIVRTYFKHPSCWTIQGRPYFSVYDLTKLMESFGSVGATRAALDRFRAKTRAAGFPDLHLNAVVWGRAVLPVEKTVAKPEALIAQLGFDSVTSYVWIHHAALPTFPTTDYQLVRDKYFEYWDKAEKQLGVPYYPNVTMGWDSSPRAAQSDRFVSAGYPFMATISGNTPAQFATAMRMTRERLAQRPPEQRILTVNCWNEWTEGSYLEPDTRHGLEYLKAVAQ